MIWIGTFYGMVNDPESAGGFETGAAAPGTIANPFVVTSIEMMLLVVLFPLMGHISDKIDSPDRRLRVMAGGTAGLFITVVPLFSLTLAHPTTGTAIFMQAIFAVLLAAIGGPMVSATAT